MTTITDSVLSFCRACMHDCRLFPLGILCFYFLLCEIICFIHQRDIHRLSYVIKAREMSKFYNSYEECLGISDDVKKVCLQIGAPGPHSLRNVAKIMKEATLKHFDDLNPRNEEILQYGCCAGNLDFKNELAKYLTECYRNPVKSEDLFIHSGASQGISNLLNYYFQRGETLFVEDPSYWNLINDLSLRKDGSYAMTTIGVGIDEDGLKLDELESHLQKMKKLELSERYPYQAALFAVPIHHNPTGCIYSKERCEGLIKLARKYDLLVISDDVYNLLTYSAPDCGDPRIAKPPPRLIWYDKKSDSDYKGSVVSISSFSKFFAPGLRVGWYEMPAKMLETFKTFFITDSGSGWNEYTSGILASALKLGLVQKHVSDHCAKNKILMQQINEIVNGQVGKYGANCNLPTGGEFMWISLPEKYSTNQLLETCKDEITFIPASKCSISKTNLHCLRICIAFYDEDVLIPAVSKLCDYIEKFVNKD